MYIRCTSGDTMAKRCLFEDRRESDPKLHPPVTALEQFQNNVNARMQTEMAIPATMASS